jgi:electron transfer flavoprotein alpha subunit
MDMQKIGLLVELNNGGLKPANLGMLTAARGLGVALSALVPEPAGEAILEELAHFGAEEIITINIDPPGWNPEHWAQAVVETMRSNEIRTLVGLTTAQGRELLPRIAAVLDAPLVMDCIQVNLDRRTAKTSQFSGKTLATMRLSGDFSIYGMRPNAVAAVADPAAGRRIEQTVRIADQSGIRVLEVIPPKGLGQNLSVADIILSGGRGMRNGENFKLLHACAKALGGSAVGASRVAVDEGWVPYSMQVGQTGTKVNPKVYIACGISGSIQHFAGMKSAGLIIAINTDPNAAIMSNCDYAVEADLFDILPELTRQLSMSEKPK